MRTYRHKRTGQEYFYLMEVHNVLTQRPDVLYMNAAGQRFTQDAELFMSKFVLHGDDPNRTLIAGKPKAAELKQLDLFEHA